MVGPKNMMIFWRDRDSFVFSPRKVESFWVQKGTVFGGVVMCSWSCSSIDFYCVATKESKVKHVLQFCNLASFLACWLVSGICLRLLTFFHGIHQHVGNALYFCRLWKTQHPCDFFGRFVCPKNCPSACGTKSFLSVQRPAWCSAAWPSMRCAVMTGFCNASLWKRKKKTPARCVSASCRWGCKPYKWPYKWVPSLKLT